MVSVSIVVPIYNVENYLDECLRSIMYQTLKDIEIICVNDGSTDRSLAIIEKYARKDKRFKIIDKPNAGYGDSMNRGFDMAVGEYVGIVESDDYIEKDMFETLYKAAKENNCEVVKSDFYEFTSKNKRNQNYINTVTDQKYYNRVLNFNDTLEIFHFKMNTWTGIYLNDFIKRNKISHNLTPGAAYQDNGFWFQTLSLAKRIMFLNRAFYHYRQDNPNSSINSKNKVFCMCDEYAFIEDFLNNRKEIRDDLAGILLVKKYFNYMYTYHRVGEEFKILFLKRFADEFRSPLESGFVKDNVKDRHIVRIIERIVKNPEIFYYEDEIWRIQHNTVDIALKLTEFKKSRKYKLLKKFRLI